MTGPNKKILLARDEAGFSKKAAEIFMESAAFAIRDNGRFVGVLPGGSTPKKILEQLVQPYYKSRIEWSKVFLFWGDERCVPPTHPDSNFKMAQEALLSKVPIPEKNIFRIPGEMVPPRDAAKAYEHAIHAFYKLEYSLPHFDLILLGVGEDGHTASLFPKTDALKEKLKWVAANYVEKISAYRLTLTLPVINASRRVLFLCAGEKKSLIVKELFRDDIPLDRYPVQLVNPIQGELWWLLDPVAASKCPENIRNTFQHL